MLWMQDVQISLDKGVRVPQKLLQEVGQSKHHLIDAYQVLGVPSDCLSDDVKAAYRLGSYPRIFLLFLQFGRRPICPQARLDLELLRALTIGHNPAGQTGCQRG